MIRFVLATLALMATSAQASGRFVPPPGPPIVDGAPVAMVREVNGSQQIIHVPRSTPAGFRQFVGDYVVAIACSGAHAFQAPLSPRTSPMGSVDEELVFVTLPEGQDANCVLSVIDRSTFPWERRFEGTIASIPRMAD